MAAAHRLRIRADRRRRRVGMNDLSCHGISRSNEVARLSAKRPSPPSEYRVPQAFGRSEEHTSELQSLMRNSYPVFCLKKKNTIFNCQAIITMKNLQIKT